MPTFSRPTARQRRALLSLGLLTMLVVLALPWAHRARPVSAHSPHPGLDFSIGVDTNGDTIDDCGTQAGGNAKCSVSTGNTFRLNVHLNSTGLPDYGAFDIYVEYTGVSSKNNPDASPWPDCVYEASFTSTPGFVAWGCTVGVPPAPNSTYTGLIGTTDFNCAAGGTITMVHSADIGVDPVNQRTFLATGGGTNHAEGQKTRETLTINCVPPAVGGIWLAPQLSNSSGGGAGLPLAQVVAGAAASAALFGGGGAWYARRRRYTR